MRQSDLLNHCGEPRQRCGLRWSNDWCQMMDKVRDEEEILLEMRAELSSHISGATSSSPSSLQLPTRPQFFFLPFTLFHQASSQPCRSSSKGPSRSLQRSSSLRNHPPSSDHFTPPRFGRVHRTSPTRSLHQSAHSRSRSQSSKMSSDEHTSNPHTQSKRPRVKAVWGRGCWLVAAWYWQLPLPPT